MTESNNKNFDYKNVDLLKRYITETGKIIPARVSNISASDQRKLTKANIAFFFGIRKFLAYPELTTTTSPMSPNFWILSKSIIFIIYLCESVYGSKAKKRAILIALVSFLCSEALMLETLAGIIFPVSVIYLFKRSTFL